MKDADRHNLAATLKHMPPGCSHKALGSIESWFPTPEYPGPDDHLDHLERARKFAGAYRCHILIGVDHIEFQKARSGRITLEDGPKHGDDYVDPGRDWFEVSERPPAQFRGAGEVPRDLTLKRFIYRRDPNRPFVFKCMEKK